MTSAGLARSDAQTGNEYEIAHLRIVPKRHIGRIVSTAIVVLLLAGLVRAFSVGQIDWPSVGQFLFAPVILQGIVNTLIMTVAAMILGVVLGVVIAIMRVSGNPVLNWIAFGYVWIFRGAPALVQLMIWFNLALIFPTLGIPGVIEFHTVDIMTPFVAAMIGLGISQGAYTSEVVRGGLLSVDSGQYEAARAIGMTQMKMLRRIVLPQAMRVMVPPIGNEVIGMVKLTSLASVIQYSEILHNAQIIYYANTRVLELLLVASFWYLAVVSVLSIGQHYIERYFGRGSEINPIVHVRLTVNKDILVKAIDVTKNYGDFCALDKVSIDIARGEVSCIIGPSGSGKSTFLRCINLLERMDGGAIWVNNELIGYRREGNNLHPISDAEISRQRQRIGMVFQRFNLFPHKTAIENIVEGPVHVLGEPAREARARGMTLLERVGLADKANHYPSQLSGGQQQRVAIARAMGMRPDLILFDEPTSALDPELVSEVLDVMRDLASSGMTMIVVTHELGFARNVANTVTFMEAGKVVETGPADAVLTTPSSARTAEFIKAVHK